MYPGKKRQRSLKRIRPVFQPSRGLQSPNNANIQQHQNSNPSKRHRERLNNELDRVASLLPYEEHVLQRLDKLSVLRLAVAFIQTKTHFRVKTGDSNERQSVWTIKNAHTSTLCPPTIGMQIPTYFDPFRRIPILDPSEFAFVDLIQKSLNAFILILKEDGDIFYVTENIESFLGHQQSRILHDSIYEYIHSEDCDGFNNILSRSSEPKTKQPSATHQSAMVRFRCILDNTSGFIRVQVDGKFIPIYTTPSDMSFITSNHSSKPDYAFMAVCTPFIPPIQMYSSLEDPIIKIKHSLDLTILNMDRRLRQIFGGDEAMEGVQSQNFYFMVHPEDVKFLADAHFLVIKSFSSGILVYRFVNPKSLAVYYIQSIFRMFFKNGKADHIGGSHRLLNEIDGESLLAKRNTVKFHTVAFDEAELPSLNLSTVNQNLKQKNGAEKIKSCLSSCARGKVYKTSIRVKNSKIGKKRSHSTSVVTSKERSPHWPKDQEKWPPMNEGSSHSEAIQNQQQAEMENRVFSDFHQPNLTTLQNELMCSAMDTIVPPHEVKSNFLQPPYDQNIQSLIDQYYSTARLRHLKIEHSYTEIMAPHYSSANQGEFSQAHVGIEPLDTSNMITNNFFMSVKNKQSMLPYFYGVQNCANTFDSGLSMFRQYSPLTNFETSTAFSNLNPLNSIENPLLSFSTNPIQTQTQPCNYNFDVSTWPKFESKTEKTNAATVYGLPWFYPTLDSSTNENSRKDNYSTFENLDQSSIGSKIGSAINSNDIFTNTALLSQLSEQFERTAAARQQATTTTNPLLYDEQQRIMPQDLHYHQQHSDVISPSFASTSSSGFQFLSDVANTLLANI